MEHRIEEKLLTYTIEKYVLSRFFIETRLYLGLFKRMDLKIYVLFSRAGLPIAFEGVAINPTCINIGRFERTEPNLRGRP